jgi:D-beta-D-heptose 7-phosphate kinase/D-beta-D-heptose 1-phosphate adenosyltransferase
MIKVAVNGCFDILHSGHLDLLNYAKSLGDYLLVCIDTDERVRELKGKGRPVNCLEDRKKMLLNLKAVDEVKIFGSSEELEWIYREYKGDFLVKGSDCRDRIIEGKQYFGCVEFFERNDKSTTKIIEKIKFK